MTIARNMMGTDIPALAAQTILGMPTTTFVANGTGVQTGNVLSSDFVIITSATNSFTFQLPTAAAASPALGDKYVVFNMSGSTCVASTTALGKIQNGSAGAGFNVVNLRVAEFYYMGADNWCVNLSA